MLASLPSSETSEGPSAQEERQSDPEQQLKAHGVAFIAKHSGTGTQDCARGKVPRPVLLDLTHGAVRRAAASQAGISECGVAGAASEA